MRKTVLAMAIGLAVSLSGHRVDAGPVLDGVKARGQVVCGLGAPTAGFMQIDRQGKWAGVAVDICRAAAAAILRDASKVKYASLAAAQCFPALQAGAGARRGPGGQLHRHLLLRRPRLPGEAVGPKSHQGPASRQHLLPVGNHDRSQPHRLFSRPEDAVHLFAFDRAEEAKAAFLAGRCEALTADISALHAMLAGNAQYGKDYAVLAQAISKEPFSPAVRQGDDQFADIVRWTLFAMIEAEEYGITSKNVDEMLKSSHPAIKNILGVTPGMGKALGVDEKWVDDIVKQVGNYGESYDRNLGDGSPLRIPRSLNALWTKAGILHVPPIR
jgi:general L-amino acid transport system substrate-binding protein